MAGHPTCSKEVVGLIQFDAWLEHCGITTLSKLFVIPPPWRLPPRENLIVNYFLAYHLKPQLNAVIFGTAI